MNAVEVRVDSRFPIFIRADADAFGAVFASMNSEEQAAVFRAMVEHMKPHPTQWDHISIELEKAEYSDVVNVLLGVFSEAQVQS